MKYNRTELEGNVGFSAVIDEKFKSCSLTVSFITKSDINTAANNFLAVGSITDSSLDYPTIASMNKALTELYGSELSSSAHKRGDLQILSVYASWLSGKYALYGEDIENDMLNIISGCLFRPNVRNGGFDPEVFAISKMELLDHIDAELNNKRGYAVSKAYEAAFSGDPAEIPCYGNRETAENSNPEKVYKAYLELLENAQIEVMYVAPQENPAVCEMISKGFSSLKRKTNTFIFNSPSKLKPQPLVITEKIDVNQCIMVLAFKTDSDDVNALRMLNLILGTTPTSKLFSNVREKLSLCYYCSSHMVLSKNALFIDCGVDRENIEEAKAEILHQLDETKNGNISDDEIENAFLAVNNALKQIGDTPSSYSSWYFERFCDGKIITPAEMADNLRNVTKERIIAAAKSFSPDTTYILLDKEENA